MPHSHHSHSGQFCRHAKSTLAEVVDEAIRQGFEVFGLSEHAPRYRIEDLFPEEADLTPSDLSSAYTTFLSTALSLRALHSSRISLLIGLETDYITALDLSQTGRLLDAHPEIDYLVGSVHHVHGVSIDFDRPTWLRSVWCARRGQSSTTMIASSINDGQPVLRPAEPGFPELEPTYTPTGEELQPFLHAYLDAQFEVLTTLRPEVVGHFDLCLLWTPNVSLKEREGLWAKVERNVRYVAGYGGLFEANAAALRKGWETSYPSRDVLHLILERGGRICLSDDSHGVGYVGLNYGRMRDYLVAMGVTEVWYLAAAGQAQDGDERVGSRGRVVARRMIGWAEHPFWKDLATRQAERGV